MTDREQLNVKSNSDENEIRQRRRILRAAVVTSFITTFMGSALNLSIPKMEGYFGVSAATIGWVVTAYSLAVAAMSVPFGKIADAMGRRPMFLTGIGSFAAVSVVCALSKSIGFLLIFRVLQGIGAAMIFATNNAILISAYPPNKRGHVLGITTAAVYVGLSLGPVVGGLLNHYVNWQSIFVASAGVSAVAFFIACRGIPKSLEKRERKQFDFPGNILYILSIVGTMYGLANIRAARWGWIVMITGIGLGVAFVIVERRAKEPVIKISMFTEDAAFTLSNLAALLNYGATFAISYLVSIYLQVVMGYSSQTAGLILISQPIMQAMFSPFMGKLSDRIAPYKLASLGMGFCAAGLVCFSLMGKETSIAYTIVILLLSGFGFALFSSPNANAIMACVKEEDYSIANSILATMRTVGHTTSMAIVTIVVGITLGKGSLTKASPDQLIGTMRIAFYIFIGLCVAGIFMSLKRRKTEDEN